MSTRRWWLAALIAGSVAMLGSAGCGSGSKSGASNSSSAKPKSIAAFTYYPAGFNDNSRASANGFQAGAAAVAGTAKVDVKSMGQLETDAGAFLNFINTGLVQQPDAIIVIPNNAAAMAAGLQKIASGGTKVILMDGAVPGFHPVSLVQTNNRAAGAQAAQYLLDQQKAGKLTSDEVAILGSPPGISSTDDRVAPFKQALAGTNLKIVADATPSCGDSETARATAADVLSAHPKLGAIFSVCDQIALGAAKALRDANRLDVQQVSIDGSKTGVQTVQQGKGINAEIAQQFYDESKTAVEVAAQAAAGKTVTAVTYIPTVLVTKANATDFLAKFAQQSAK